MLSKLSYKTYHNIFYDKKTILIIILNIFLSLNVSTSTKVLTYSTNCLHPELQLITFMTKASLNSIKSLFFDGGKKYKIRKIVIDAGHGGKDPGAVGKKSYEKNITLAIALKLGKYIKKYIKGVEVIYTRKTDVFVELHKRAEIANKNNADLFISIHVNSNRKTKPYGTSTYVMGLHKSEENLDVAKRENSVILVEKNYKSHYEGFDPNSPESHIVFSLFQNAYLDQSLNLAQKIQKQFKLRARRKDGGVRQAGLLVLWQSTMPSVLVETGFISNRKEERYLMSSKGQDYIAYANFRAFRDYKKQNESKSNFINIRDKKEKTNVIKDTKKENTKNKKTVRFKVQIKSSPIKVSLKSRQFRGIKNIKEYKFKGVYKYYVGNRKSIKSVLELQKKIRKKIPDAFVVAYIGDKRISISEAKRILKKK